MTIDHVTFQKMSELYDNDITDGADRQRLMSHIGSCTECGCEYDRLGRTLQLCRDFSCQEFCLDGLSARTMKKISWGSRKKIFYKSIPAVAASILIIAGVGIFSPNVFNTGNKSFIANLGAKRSLSESEKVIDIIQRHRATISDVTEQYVEGRVSVSTFERLRRELGSRKVQYMIVEDNGTRHGGDWNNPIEEVGAGDMTEGMPVGPNADVPQRQIMFRVFR